MSSSKFRGKQHFRDRTEYLSERRQTRRSAKENRIEVPDLSLEDLEAITRKARVPKPQPRPSRFRSNPQSSRKIETNPETLSSRNRKLISAAKGKLGAQQSKSGATGIIRSHESSAGQHQPSKLGRKDRPRAEPQPHPHPTQLDIIGRSADRESQERTLVSSWLNLTSQANPNDLEKPNTPSSRLASVDISGMDTSSSHNASSTNENGVAPSTRASTVRKATANTFMEHLELRGITDIPSKDDLLEVHGIMDKLVQQSGNIECRQLDSLVTILYNSIQMIKNSIEEGASEDGFLLYDSLREEILDWIPDSAEYRRFPPVCARHFEWDQNQCDNSNEADFQRTIMIEIIDRYDFKDKFAFSCEEMWSVEPQFLIKPSRKNSVIKQPKPDLAISFQRDIIKKSGRLDYPIELRSCLHPGNKGRQRWFPFLFLEAKRDDSSLRDAFETNLLNASQALSNIYQWMRQIPELKQKFFNEVRVMTITLNNRDLTLRIHRAEKKEGGYLQFEYMTVREILRYSRFEACHLIKGVLLDFALPHLLPILADTYDKVAKLNFQRDERLKRKQPAMSERSNGQTDSIYTIELTGQENVLEQPVESTGNSFAMGQMEVSRSPTDIRPESTGGNPPKRSRRAKKNTAGK